MNNTTRTTNLTAAQIQTLQRILAQGGKVFVTMGSLKNAWNVNKRTVIKLAAMGMVTGYNDCTGGYFQNLTVTACGCAHYMNARERM